MDVVISGSRGLIGSAVSESLKADGHRVIPLVRPGSSQQGIRWDPDAGDIDTAGLEGVDAVVHLAGEGIASHRWTDEQRRRILNSRVRGTTVLSEALAGLASRPKVLVSGSAVGWYGDRGDTELTEASTGGDDFLAGVCRAWEASTATAQAAGVRTVHIRSGVVLSGTGGALPKQLLPFKLGLGGPAGSGRQWLSWISLDDEVGAIRYVLDHDVLSGPVNLTAPAPCTNAEFARALGRALHRPTVLRIPRLVTKLPLGVGDLVESLLFTSARVLPKALIGHGYDFRHADVDAALRAALGPDGGRPDGGRVGPLPPTP